MSEKKGAKNGENVCFFWEIMNKITELEYIKKMVVLRSSPNDMKQLLKFSNFYLKPNFRNNSVKTVNFEILKSRDIEILSLGVKKNVNELLIMHISIHRHLFASILLI